MGFYVAVRYALERGRAGASEPARITANAWEELIGLDEASIDAILQGPFADLLRYQRLFHQRILDEFSNITDAELELPSLYWEDHPHSLRFRLGRFDSHLRQHTVQIDKTLAALNLAPSEARRLLRLIYGALAEAQGNAIGAAPIGAELSAPVAASIAARASEIEAILAERRG